MAPRPTIVQINLAPTLGGAEVYTAFMSRALSSRGWPTRAIVSARAHFWRDLDFGGVERVGVSDGMAAAALLAPGEIALIHGSLPLPVLKMLRGRGPILGIAHQAIYDTTRPAYFHHADLLYGVSQHVLATLRGNGVANIYDQPLFGIGDVHRLHAETTPVRGPLCEWDERKFFEKLIAAGQRALASRRPATRYAKRPGVTLGIVSRIAKAKQFPTLFDVIAPLIHAQPRVNVEIFGVAVGGKQLRELRQSVRPLGSRVRFWGHQRDVVPAYRGIDYLLLGLPDREALGLNVIESCLCSTPVLAIDSPPFTETMRDGVTGYLYVDPRRDGGRHFAQVLAEIADGTRKPEMASASAHLEQFSFDHFANRVDSAMHAGAVAAGSRPGNA
ncbi:MAG: glycosyltransferase [Betaproteobacteria bacterium]